MLGNYRVVTQLFASRVALSSIGLYTNMKFVVVISKCRITIQTVAEYYNVAPLSSVYRIYSVNVKNISMLTYDP
jgi:hypothetical protein